MILELTAIVGAVNTATSAINKVASTTSDIQQISSFLGTLGEAQYDLQKLKVSKPLSAKDAIQHQLAQKKISDTMSEMKDMFLISGNGQLWEDAMAAMAEARKARQAEINRIEKIKKQRIKEFKEAGLVLLIGIIIIPIALGGVLYFLDS
tara:strand:- start:1376 stop:1825 length:450 start_codon:yes stop_codon:yes gene_type:complete